MDIFSHGFWAGAGAEFLNRKMFKERRKLNVRWAAFWGVAPDVFSFGFAFAWLFLRWATGQSEQFFPHDPAHPELQFGTGDPSNATIPLGQLTAILYQFTHSAVIFFAVFGVIVLFRLRSRRIPWEMAGWLFHILIDIPTHSYRFYPTPALWPLSEWRFDGFSWGTPWFLITDYLAILAVYFFFLRRRQKPPVAGGAGKREG